MSTFKAISREQGSENTLHQHLLGFFVRPVQPINAELVVDVAFPGDETAVESVQQFGGNLVSAMLVPVARRVAKLDYQLLLGVLLLASDIRGNVVFMMVLAVSTFCYYRSFNAPLHRSMADGGCTATTINFRGSCTHSHIVPEGQDDGLLPRRDFLKRPARPANAPPLTQQHLLPTHYPQHPAIADKSKPSGASKASVAAPPNLALRQPLCELCEASAAAVPPPSPWPPCVQGESMCQQPT
jgi:hypothetical protein